eukprot:TRINITY_DN3436_c0_g2_i2.p1 TRINITY_DN3436_c0_g2~~TRINITY_DN3436_c0_g2_i2.p1  ORF type:complete len:136 (-),score=1.78 TRINITY_DN3436_c0_g2_i2:146-553(-)
MVKLSNACLSGSLLVCVMLACAGSSQAKTITVGGGMGHPLSPWRVQVQSWKAPTVKAGDKLLFRWVRAHDLWQFDDATAFTNCDFLNAKNIKKSARFGFYRYSVASGDAGKTIYFGCAVGAHCVDKMKVAIPISA